MTDFSKEYLLIDHSSAEKLLSDLHKKFPEWYHRTHQKTFDVDRQVIGNTKYYNFIGKVLHEDNLISGKGLPLRWFYHITKKRKSENLDLRLNSGLFSKVLCQPPKNYGSVSDEKFGKETTSIKTVKSSGDEIENIELYKDIVSTKWILFASSDTRDPNRKLKIYNIHKSLIEFKEDERFTIDDKRRWKVNIWSNIGAGVMKYSGIFGLRKLKKGSIYLETSGLEIEEYSKKHLRMMFYFGKFVINELALGVYYNVRYHGGLMAGSAILVADKLEHAEFVNTGTKVKHYSNFNELEQKFKNNVGKFFERRNMNYLKLPNLWYNYGDDEKFHTLRALEIINQANLKSIKGREVWLPHYEVFISTPLTFSQNEKYYKRNKKTALDFIDSMTSFYNISESDFYFAGKNKTLKELRNDINIPNETIHALERSTTFVLLLPYHSTIDDNTADGKISSSFTELGYAMGLKKNILILVEKLREKSLPNNIKLFQERGMLTTFTLEQFDLEELSFFINVNKDIIGNFCSLELKSFRMESNI